MTRIVIKPPTVIFFLLLTLADRTMLVLVPFGAAVFHELGHLFVMTVLGYDAEQLEITVFGAEIKTAAHFKSAWHTAAVYLAGGMANIFCAAAALPFLGRFAAVDLLAGCSIALAVINLAPIRSLDGGCIMEAVIGAVIPQYSEKVISAVSGVTLTVLWLVGSYTILMLDANLSLLLFCLYLFIQLYM